MLESEAFDNVRHKLLATYLQELGLHDKDVRLIANLYWHQAEQIRLQNSATTEEFEIRKGVRQGCILSPMLFSLYVERVFAEIVWSVLLYGAEAWMLKLLLSTVLKHSKCGLLDGC
nr:unnamed protein product [Callosobruchus chinensis]